MPLVDISDPSTKTHWSGRCLYVPVSSGVINKFCWTRQTELLQICFGFAAGFDVSTLSRLKAHSRTSLAQQLRKTKYSHVTAENTPVVLNRGNMI